MCREVIEEADTAYEAIRAINHLTINRTSIPAPEVYSILGNLKLAAGYSMKQALEQIAAGLSNSTSEYNVYDNKRDPEESIDLAVGYLAAAAMHAGTIGELLEKAQTAINSQGYNEAAKEVDGD
jgi:hypothetical protein